MSTGVRTVEVRPLTQVEPTDFERIVTGYTASEVYRMTQEESGNSIGLRLTIMPRATLYVKQYPPLDDELSVHYQAVLEQGCSFGAYAGEELVGLALAELQRWNGTLWVWELHVAEAWRGHGIGRKLVDTLVAVGKREQMRVLTCETQNTNVAAVRFYQRMGFRLEGIDISYYANTTEPDEEIALFMKLRL